LLPVITTLPSVCPCAPLLGLTLLTPGAGVGALLTVNPLSRLPLCIPGFVTLTVRPPVAALAAIVMLAVSCVADLNVQLFTVIPLPKLHVAPLTKLLPVIPTLLSVCPTPPLLGLTLLTTGAGVGRNTCAHSKSAT